MGVKVRKWERTLKAKINKVAYIGWRSLDYEEITLDSAVLTGLIGPTGAGKSTLAMCLCYALLPDRKVLDVRPISEIQDSHLSGIDFMTSLINPSYNYAYVVLDITSKNESRMLAGIHVSVKDGRGEFKRWIIKDVPKDISLQNIMRVEEGDHEFYPDIHELSRHLARKAVNPMDLVQLRTVGDYGTVLHDAGIIPTDLVSNHERSLYAKIIETSFRGGISSEVSAKLKDYLLPTASRISDTVSKLQECTDQVLKTRNAIQTADKQLDILESVYGKGQEIVANACRRIKAKLSEGEKNLASLNKELSEKEKILESLNLKLSELDKQIKIAEETAEQVQKTKRENIFLLDAQIEQISKELLQIKQEENNAYQKLTTFTEAGKLWRSLAGKYSNQSLKWFKEWVDKELDRLGKEYYRIEETIEKLEMEKAELERGASDIKTDTLSRILGSSSLGQVFHELSAEEAIRVELGLGGLTAGIVGCSPDRLADVASDETLPDVFWIGEEKPSAAPVTESGDWYISHGLEGGFTVFSKKRAPILGAQAREKKKRSIETEIAYLKSARDKTHKEKEHLNQTKDELLKHEEKIQFFLENKKLY